MSLKFEDFTKQQRNVIAEFVYSNETEILIKSDIRKLVEVFLDKNLIDNQHSEALNEKIENNVPVVEELSEILLTSIEENEGKKIMDEYFGRRSNAVD